MYFFRELPGNAMHPEVRKYLPLGNLNHKPERRLSNPSHRTHSSAKYRIPVGEGTAQPHPSGNRLLTMISTSVTLPRQINEPSRHGIVDCVGLFRKSGAEEICAISPAIAWTEMCPRMDVRTFPLVVRRAGGTILPN